MIPMVPGAGRWTRRLADGLRRWCAGIAVGAALLGPAGLRAADPLLRTNDVIALVGGEAWVAAEQDGELEARLVAAHPHHRLRFRSLAWEGDTVFAQPREVNYPALVPQLREIGATTVWLQFGRVESHAGPAGLERFVAATQALLDQLQAVTPRLVLVAPMLGPATGEAAPAAGPRYVAALRDLAGRRKIPFLDPSAGGSSASAAARLASLVSGRPAPPADAALAELRRAVRDKNRLWFEYRRPTNWAFLAGDRTEQLFSRDPRDPSRRLFAEEMQQFVPLIAAADEAVDRLARTFQPTEATR